MYILMLIMWSNLDRGVKILNALENENHFKCDKESMQLIGLLCTFSKLSNEDIQKEILYRYSIKN